MLSAFPSPLWGGGAPHRARAMGTPVRGGGREARHYRRRLRVTSRPPPQPSPQGGGSRAEFAALGSIQSRTRKSGIKFTNGDRPGVRLKK
jgi:hypothetical protein